jgi:hypothetical protein
VPNLVFTIKGGTQTEGFENRVLRRIFGPKRDEVKGDCRILHDDELHNLFSSTNIIRMMKSRRMSWAGHVARMGVKRNAYGILVGKPEGKRPLGKPRCRWDGMHRIELAKERDQWRALVNMVMNLGVP